VRKRPTRNPMESLGLNSAQASVREERPGSREGVKRGPCLRGKEAWLDEPRIVARATAPWRRHLTLPSLERRRGVSSSPLATNHEGKIRRLAFLGR
jgi:hypothetical protein